MTNSSYATIDYHRNGHPEKSQWTISEAEEINCFKLSENNKWLLQDHGWGLHFINGKADFLGIAQDRVTLVFIAKFVAKSPANAWHGYPADYRNNSKDIPAECILKEWLNKKIISTAKIRKITKGQPCSL
jgi:hypothetical protein